ncbi:MAG: N-acetyl-D-Glu racemase DgcA [Candidatus Puniceispirillales bacterium]|tara:strand:+ start:152 stop:1117 length:966 start_codon:yes stop_codon:yes gene_type:complete
MNIKTKVDVFPLKKLFTISRGSRTEAEVVSVKVSKDGFTGYGECVPYKRYNETVKSVIDQITNLNQVNNRYDLEQNLPPGAARNALDCAFWDLEAKLNNTSVADLINLSISPVITSFTLSLDTSEKMGQEAQLNSHLPILKIKLGGGNEDLERIKSVRKFAPQSDIIVDANEGWSLDEYNYLMPHFVEAKIKMIEQPFPSQSDGELKNINRPIPICADESCHDTSSLEKCIGKYDVINIKLDKTGGLTEALKLKKNAELRNFDIMVGCMVGSSLAMAPAIYVAQNVKWVDLDGPLLLSEDRKNPLKYSNSKIHPPLKDLWG